MRRTWGSTVSALAVATLVGAGLVSGPAQAAPSRFLVRGDTMAPPTGFVAMCQTDGTFCQAQQDAASPADAALNAPSSRSAVPS